MTDKRWFGLGVIGATTIASFVVGTGRAQVPDGPEPVTSASVSASGSVSIAPVASVPPKPTATKVEHVVVAEHPSEHVEEKPSPSTDHEQVIGHLAIGYFGQFDVPIGFTNARKAGSVEGAQMIGIRYWWRRVALDLALGVNLQAGSQQVIDKSTDQPSTLVFAARIALPVALYVGPHYTFFLGPEFAYGHSGETIPGQEVPTGVGTTRQLPDTTHGGSRIAIGGRAGAEIHFGFIGIPHLALDATVALALDFTNGNTTAPPTTAVPPPGTTDPNSTIEAKYSHIGFQSSISHQPWNIFISNVAAVYYF